MCRQQQNFFSFVQFLVFSTESLKKREKKVFSALKKMNNDFSPSSSMQMQQEQKSLNVKALQTAIQVLQSTILQPHFNEVQNICSLWKEFPPKLESTRNNSDLETVFAEVREKRKDLNFDEYVAKMLS